MNSYLCEKVCEYWYQSTVIIEKLKFLNLEVNTGKIISTKENINIRCRFNSSEEHTWHSSHSQLNLLVDLVHNLYITWGKRQDDLDIKLERLYKEHKQIEEDFSLLQNNLNLVLQILEERKVEQNKYCQNSDYIKEEVSLLRKKIESKRVATELEDIKLQEEDSKAIIRQNNTILQLLTQIQEKINTESTGKELVLASTGIVSSTISINSDKWTYLKVSAEEINPSRQ